MNPILFLMYAGIVIGTTILMTILVKYLNEKALQRQQVKDQVPVTYNSKYWSKLQGKLLKLLWTQKNEQFFAKNVSP